MEVSKIKNIIKDLMPKHKIYIKECTVGERYYKNDNDILYDSARSSSDNPIRNADNRIPRNFHALLVNQKAAYLMTAPPLFDTGKKNINQQIADILGDEYPKYCKDLCVNAANKSVAWVHYWLSDEKKFEYAVVDSEQIMPIYCNDLKQHLIAVLRTYISVDDDGKKIAVWEYWDDKACYAFQQNSSNSTFNALSTHDIFAANEDGERNVMKHDFGEVPFVPFYNNNVGTNDLQNIKKLIDAYDKVFSGFLNDLEDIQEVIFILTNYGGADKKEYLEDLKKYKMINLESEGDGDKSGLSTINIEIPIEARKTFLEITRRAIFEQGQGVDPNPEKFGSASGEALKFLYSLLELKAGFTETEFKPGFGRLIRAICRHLGVECDQIVQIWTRTAVTNDKELAEIAAMSKGITSDKSILQYHPLVDNVDDEMEQIKKEEEEYRQENDIYRGVFGNVGDAGGEEEKEE